LRNLIDRIQNRLLRYSGIDAGTKYLQSYGWQASRRLGQPIDAQGSPIPWITYPALTVLRSVVKPEYRVFEYGCGNSSLWWASHASSVVSVEHNEDWAAKVSARAPANLTVLLKPLMGNEQRTSLVDQFYARKPDLGLSRSHELNIEHGMLTEGFSDYATEATRYDPFDVIVVDGMARSLSTWVAAHCLKPDGFIVFDNSDRWQYNAGYQALADLGFGRVDFWGPGPVNPDPWCTSIFYRTPKWSMPLISVSPQRKTGIDWVIEKAISSR
jgi:hypothetical protein